MSEQRARQPRRGPMGGHGGGPMMGASEKAKDFKGTVKRLVRYLSRHKVPIILVMIFAVASTVFLILGPKILGNVTTELFTGAMGMLTGTGKGINFDSIRNALLLLVGLYVLSAAFSYLQGFLMTGVTMKVTYNLRKEIAAKINRLPLRYFDSRPYGEVLSHITNDVDAMTQNLNQSITQVITSVTTILGILIMMFSISGWMSLVALLVIPVSLLFITAVIRKSQPHFLAQQEYLGHVNGHIEEMYGSHVVVKAFSGEQASVEAFDKNNEMLYKSAWKSQFLSGMMQPVMNFISNIGYVIVCVLGAFLAANGSITIGNIQAFIQYMRQFTQPISQVANISNIFQMTAAAAERVFEFLDEEEEIPETEHPVKVQNVIGSVAFDHVHFGYNPERVIVNDFSAEVLPGKKVAIVGPTGAGKTTMVKLLMRFYDVTGGAIYVDGTDIRNYTREDLRSFFGMVLQDTWLYHATIMENIRYGRQDATDEEVIAAAKAAGVDHFIRTLPDGYQMVLNEEANNVSQGQKQLLTIARAILANPPILILDEATSSVDTRTELLIQRAMDNLMQNRTSFIIAHRLSTIRNADLILVMKDGDIIEQGNHEELMARNGFYASLYNSQFEKSA